MTKTQATRGKRKVRARARRRGRRAAAQAAPLAVSASAAARRGVHSARTWAAPRLERTGHTLEQRVAPRVAAMLSATARRVDPAPRKRRHRWPLLTAGFVTAAGLSAGAAYLINRRKSGLIPGRGQPQPTFSSSSAPEPAAETAGSDVNGRVRTS